MSQWYGHENGRFASACSLLIASGLPHWLFSLLNGFFAGVLVVGMAGLMRLSGWKTWVSMALFFIVVLNHESCLWMAGAVNYLWPAALTICLVRLFLSSAMEGRAYLVKNLWMWLSVPVAFFVAGFHELFCIQIALLLFVYWLPKLFKGRVVLDGRFVMSLGYAFGAIVLVLSPTTFSRPSSVGMFSRGVGNEVVKRVISSINTALYNPMLIVLFVFILVCVSVPVVRRRMRVRHGLVVASLFLALVIVDWGFALGGGGREVFVVTLCVMAGIIEFGRVLLSGKALILCVAMGLGLSILTMSVTFIKQMDKANFTDRSVKEWIESDDIFIVRERPNESRIGHWIDRSFTYSQFSEIGDGWGNQRLSDYYSEGKRKCIGISKPEYEALKNGCRGFTRLDIDGDWLVSPDLDIIVTSGGCTGARYIGHPQYLHSFKPERPLGLLFKRIMRTGWGDVPSLAPDAEIRGNANLQGYVFSGPKGKRLFFFHNRHVNRNLIQSFSYSCE